MAAEVLPEVKEKEQEEQQRKLDAKRLMAKQLAVGPCMLCTLPCPAVQCCSLHMCRDALAKSLSRSAQHTPSSCHVTCPRMLCCSCNMRSITMCCMVVFVRSCWADCLSLMGLVMPQASSTHCPRPSSSATARLAPGSEAPELPW